MKYCWMLKTAMAAFLYNSKIYCIIHEYKRQNLCKNKSMTLFITIFQCNNYYLNTCLDWLYITDIIIEFNIGLEL